MIGKIDHVGIAVRSIEEARRFYEQAAARASDAETRRLLGDLALWGGDYELAIANYRYASDLAPSDPDLREELSDFGGAFRVPNCRRDPRATDVGKEVLRVVELDGLVGPTTVVVEAIDTQCPFPGAFGNRSVELQCINGNNSIASGVDRCCERPSGCSRSRWRASRRSSTCGSQRPRGVLSAWASFSARGCSAQGCRGST